MKARLTSGAFVLIATLLVVSIVGAQSTPQAALPGGNWSTGIQVQNVGDGIAQIVLTGYDAEDDDVFVDDTTGKDTAVGASVNYVTFPSDQTSFQGAGVVSSDKKIVAIVNVNNGAGGNYAAGQYQGTSNTIADTTVLFPLVKNNFGKKCTLFYVQNAGSAGAKIYATFSNGSKWNSGSDVDAGDMVIVDPASATPAVPSTAPYALTVTSTQKIAGTVLEFFCTADPAAALQATRGFAPADGDTTLLAPIYKMEFNNRTNGLQVQNVSGGPADIVVTYAHSALSGGSGTYKQWQKAVPAGASVTFFKNVILAASGGGTTGSSGTALASGSLAAATITSTGQIVAINNESYDPVPANVSRNTQTTYSALPASAAGTKVGIPLVKEEFANKTTGIQIQNAGSGTAEVKVTFNLNAPSGASCLGTYTLQNIDIDENASVTLFRTNTGFVPDGSTWLGDAAIKKGCFGGATVEVVSGGPVVAVVQEADINPTASARQDTKNYEGFKIE
jgi:hypothetical protein